MYDYLTAALQHNTAVWKPVAIEKAISPIERLSVGPAQGKGPKLVRFGNSVVCLEWSIMGSVQKRVSMNWKECYLNIYSQTNTDAGLLSL